jgi:hypothetical protein
MDAKYGEPSSSRRVGLKKERGAELITAVRKSHETNSYPSYVMLYLALAYFLTKNPSPKKKEALLDHRRRPIKIRIDPYTVADNEYTIL